MKNDKSISASLIGHTECIQRIKPLHGRTSGPARRSTKGQWTAEEDDILRKAVQRFKGKNWKKIAECFKDRTDVQCLHRWQKVLNPELVKGPWSKEEDEIIIELVDKYGPKKWSTIAQHLPGRIGKQCRERWHNHLNPSINKEAWTQEEELALIRAHQVYGNRWAELTKFLPGRSDNSIKNHWNSSVKKKLDSYLASGLLEQFQGLPLGAHQNQAMPRVQSTGDDFCPGFGMEAEEISECSQDSTFAGCSQSGNGLANEVSHGREEFQPSLGKERSSSPASCSDQYFVSVGDATFSIPEVPLQNFSSSNMTSASHQLALNDPSFIGHITDNSYKPDCVMITEDELFSDELNGGGILSSGNFDKEQNSVACGRETNQLGCHSSTAHEQDFVVSTHDGFIYTNCNTSSPCNCEQKYLKEPSKLVPVNSFASDTDAIHSCPVKEIPATQQNQEENGSLCYEPPRFPRLDIPFLSCDLVQSGSDIQQDYSPLGIRQLMMSSMNCLTPFRLWDSPTRDDSPKVGLKSAAKAFNGAPSILKKRSRDMLSPLSDRRVDKKLEIDLASNLTKEFSKLDVVFGESDVLSIEDKENLNPLLQGGEQKGRISDKNGHTDASTQAVGQSSAVITEDSLNDILFFSPDQVGFKADKPFVPGSHTPKNLYRIILGTLSEKADISSPTNGKKSRENQTVATTSGLHGDASTETHSIFGGIPFRRSIESPSAWKSPWFMNSFLPGPRVDTDISIEDMGYFMSPGDRSYDAITLMKQLSEQNASAYADALEFLGNETPETLLEKRRSNCQVADQSNNATDAHAMTECRMLDFSECDTPGKKGNERAKSSTAVSLSSPSSFLLKSCR